MIARGGDTEGARSLAEDATTAVIAWDVERARERIRSATAGLERRVEALIEARDDASPAASNRLELEIATQRARIAELRTLEALAASPIERAGAVAESVVQIGPRPLRDAVLAAVLAVLAAIGILLVRATVRRE